MRSFHVLILCTGNSARSILAEATFNSIGKPWFQAFSAGSHPAGKVHPGALQQLAHAGLSQSGYRSKSWDNFITNDAPSLDFVITVCDNAAVGCPTFPGDYEHIHWGLPDPAAITDEQERGQVFSWCHNILRRRVRALTELPLNTLCKQDIANEMRALASVEQTEIQPPATFSTV